MSPLQLEILFWYYTRPNDYGDGVAHAPKSFIVELVDVNLLEVTPRRGLGESAYKLTERGEFYLDAILAMPLPVAEWVIPDNNLNAKKSPQEGGLIS